MTTQLSELERAILTLVANENWSWFNLEAVEVTGRLVTGAGRCTHLADRLEQRLPDGTYTAQGHVLEIEGIVDGAAFLVDVSDERIRFTEIALYTLTTRRKHQERDSAGKDGVRLHQARGHG